MRATHVRVAFALLALLGSSVPALAALTIAVPARLPEELPSPPAGKLAPGFQVAVDVDGRYLGLTTDGLTVIRLPTGKRIEDVRSVLPKASVFTSPAPNQYLDRFDEVVLLFDAATPPPPVGAMVLGKPVLRQNEPRRFAVLKVHNPISPALLRRLADLPGIRFVEPNYRFRLTTSCSSPAQSAPPPPNDPEYLTDTPWGLAKIHAPVAWSVVHDSPAMVAILDTGIDLTHPDLVCNLAVNTAEIPGNTTDDDGNGCVDDVFGCDFVNGGGNVQDGGHGTWVAGIIGAAGSNGQGTVGVAWHVPLLAVRVFASPSVYADEHGVYDAIEYAVHRGARILNASWSAGGAQSVLVSDAITDADNAGALFIAATGNNSGDIDTFPDYPASYAHANIIAVSSTTDGDILGGGVGKVSVDLGAPGIQIKTTLVQNQYGCRSGTSFAAPHVSGAAALVWGHPAYATLSAHGVRQLILDHVEKVPSFAGQCATEGRLDLQFLGPTPPPPLP
jgi:hypothetical protein